MDMAGQFSLNCTGNDPGDVTGKAGAGSGAEAAHGRARRAAVSAPALRHGHWLTGESRFVPHPQERREECAAALLTEITGDHFPALRVQGRDYEPAAGDLIQDAACALADFAAALLAGSDGPGCPGRAEEEVADETCNRGDDPCCTVCGTGIHMLRGLAGWHHLRSGGTADDEAGVSVVARAGHEPVLGWRAPATPEGPPSQAGQSLVSLSRP
jgi:hypothetical protein